MKCRNMRVCGVNKESPTPSSLQIVKANLILERQPLAFVTFPVMAFLSMMLALLLAATTMPTTRAFNLAAP